MVWLGSAALTIVVLAAILWTARLPLATAALMAAMAEARLSPVSFAVTSLEWRTARIENLRIGHDGSLVARSVEVAWQPERLLDGRIETASMTGLAVRIAIDEQGDLAVQGLPPGWFAPDDGTGEIRLPFGTLDLEIVRADIATTHGAFGLSGTAHVAAGEDGRVDVRAALMAPTLAVGRVRAGDVSLRLVVAGDPANLPGLGLTVDAAAGSVVAGGLDLG